MRHSGRTGAHPGWRTQPRAQQLVAGCTTADSSSCRSSRGRNAPADGRRAGCRCVQVEHDLGGRRGPTDVRSAAAARGRVTDLVIAALRPVSSSRSTCSAGQRLSSSLAAQQEQRIGAPARRNRQRSRMPARARSVHSVARLKQRRRQQRPRTRTAPASPTRPREPATRREMRTDDRRRRAAQHADNARDEKTAPHNQKQARPNNTEEKSGHGIEKQATY